MKRKFYKLTYEAPHEHTFLSMKTEFSSLMIPDGVLSCNVSSQSEESSNMWQSQFRDGF